MRNRSLLIFLAAAGALPHIAGAVAAGPFASRVVSYTPGDDANGVPLVLNNTDPTAAIGEPTRITAPGEAFGGPTTPFSASFGSGETVSIGVGGSLTVAFDEPVTNDPNNPFGIDLIVFGNSFLGLNFPPTFITDETTTANGALFSEGGVVEVSSDGVTFVEVVGAEADGLFPTAGFSDISVPFPASASIESDFTLPVDPSLTAANFDGLTTAEVLALYDGSGGGLGIDIGLLNLSEVSFVRVSTPLGSAAVPEIDGFADVRAVPEPTTLLLAAAACGALLQRRRQG